MRPTHQPGASFEIEGEWYVVVRHTFLVLPRRNGKPAGEDVYIVRVFERKIDAIDPGCYDVLHEDVVDYYLGKPE